MLTVIQSRFDDNADLWAIADRLNCELAVKEIRREDFYGLVGNTYSIKDQLKAAGFRWDADRKAWFATRAQFLSIN